MTYNKAFWINWEKGINVPKLVCDTGYTLVDMQTEAYEKTVFRFS